MEKKRVYWAGSIRTFAAVLYGDPSGARWGTLAVLAYILPGLVGTPVFSAFQGGFPVLAGKTGGGFFALPAVYSAPYLPKNHLSRALAALLSSRLRPARNKKLYQ